MISYKQAIDDIAAALGRSSGVDYTSRDVLGKASENSANKQVEEIKLRKATVDLSTAMKVYSAARKKDVQEFKDSFKFYSKVNAHIFDQAVEKLSYSQFKTLPNLLKNKLSESTIESNRIMSRYINSLQDVYKMQKRIAALNDGTLQKLHALNEQRNLGPMSEEQYAEIEKQAQSLGLSLKDLKKPFDKLEEETIFLSDAFNESAKQIEKASASLTEKLLKHWQTIAAVGAPIVLAGKEMAEAARSAAHFGTSLNIADSLLMGMAPEDVAELQGKHKQSIMSLGITYDEYNDKLKTAVEGYIDLESTLLDQTGSMKLAVEVMAANITNLQNLGGAYSRSKDFIDQQTDLFVKFNKQFSMTGEQFIEMNDALIKDNKVREVMMRLNIKDRAIHLKQLQMAYEKLRIDGLLHDQALAAVSALEELSGMKAKDRLAAAAKSQAVMGAMGLGKEGKQFAEMLRRGFKGQNDKTNAIAILKIVSDKMSAAQASGNIGLEMQMQALVQAWGIGGSIEDMIKNLQLQKGQEIKQSKLQSERKRTFADDPMVAEALTAGMKTIDTYSSFMKGPMYAAAAGTAVASAGIYKLLQKMNLKRASRGVGYTGKEISGRGNTHLGKIGSAGSTLLKGAGYAFVADMAWETGQLIGTKIYEAIDESDFANSIGETMSTIVGWFDDETARLNEQAEKRKRDSDPIYRLKQDDIIGNWIEGIDKRDEILKLTVDELRALKAYGMDNFDYKDREYVDTVLKAAEAQNANITPVDNQVKQILNQREETMRQEQERQRALQQIEQQRKKEEEERLKRYQEQEQESQAIRKKTLEMMMQLKEAVDKQRLSSEEYNQFIAQMQKKSADELTKMANSRPSIFRMAN